LADVELFVDGNPAFKGISLNEQIAGLQKGDKVRIVIIGYSYGAENAIASVTRIEKVLRDQGLIPEIHLVLIDAIDPGTTRSGKKPYTGLTAGVKPLLTTFLNYYQTKGDGPNNLVGGKIAGQDNTDGDVTTIVGRYGVGNFFHEGVDNALANGRAKLQDVATPDLRPRLSLAEIIARWEVLGF
jgi:hypothetical protein